MRGYYAIAFGEQYARIAADLAASILTHSALPLCVAVNDSAHMRYLPTDARIAKQLLPWPTDANRLAKASSDLFSPWQRSMLLDADYLMLDARADAAFDMLDQCDIAAQIWTPKFAGDGPEYFWNDQVTALGQAMPIDAYQSTVLFEAGRKATRDLFALWRANLVALLVKRSIRAGRDMPPLSCAVRSMSANVGQLPRATSDYTPDTKPWFLHYNWKKTPNGYFSHTINKDKPFDE